MKNKALALLALGALLFTGCNSIGDKDTIETGISEIAVKAESKKEVFDLAGRRVSAPV